MRKLSEAIHYRNEISALAYDRDRQRLYLGVHEKGLEVWDVTTATSPIRLGACRTANTLVGIAHQVSWVMPNLRSFISLSAREVLRAALPEMPEAQVAQSRCCLP